METFFKIVLGIALFWGACIFAIWYPNYVSEKERREREVADAREQEKRDEINQINSKHREIESELKAELKKKEYELVQREIELIHTQAQSIQNMVDNGYLDSHLLKVSSNYCLYNMDIREQQYKKFVDGVDGSKEKQLCSLFWDYFYRICNYMQFSNAITYKENVHVLSLLHFVFYYILYIKNYSSEESFDTIDNVIDDLILDCSLLHLFDIELFYSTKYFFRYNILKSDLLPRYDWLCNDEKPSKFVQTNIPLKASSVFCDIIINAELSSSKELEIDYYSSDLCVLNQNPTDIEIFRKNVVPCIFDAIITLSDTLQNFK